MTTTAHHSDGVAPAVAGDGGHPGQHRDTFGDSVLVARQGYFWSCALVGTMAQALPVAERFTLSSGPWGLSLHLAEIEAGRLLRHHLEDPGHRPCETFHWACLPPMEGIRASSAVATKLPAALPNTVTPLGAVPVVSSDACVASTWPTSCSQEKASVAPPPRTTLSMCAPREAKLAVAPGQGGPLLVLFDVSSAQTNYCGS